MKEIEHGNCYNFDLPDDCLNEEETRDVINALMFDLRRTPVGTKFILDISIGPARESDMSWQKFLASRVKFKRADFEKANKKIAESEAIDFLREHFAEMLTLPEPEFEQTKPESKPTKPGLKEAKPGLRRIK